MNNQPSKQTTVASSVSLEGVGLHTGNTVKITFAPAPENTGYVFRRVDLKGNPLIEANALLVTSTQRGTCLEKEGVKVYPSSHTLRHIQNKITQKLFYVDHDIPTADFVRFAYTSETRRVFREFWRLFG